MRLVLIPLPAWRWTARRAVSLAGCRSVRLMPACLVPALGLLDGCSLDVAPSFPVVGAYFPAWMFCALVGIAVAIGARVLCLAVGIDDFLSFRLFTYVSLGVLAALAVWLAVFGP
ncbi:hypothetical protein GLI01_31700 [Gluconacetobacter liquefaciens]|uniref:Uncharacterized protein YtcA n=2 Tax=Gluconacetobacter liquefaciens TaxID=89584 RepID=A0A370G027_GLULI|nr:hypothetical protein [Gluconacetobacter liquefaciens]RDI36239.1 YtcA family uncharacterized protein [Gluconacetobacter liquefaciens]GBQ99320.1 hypothetical protein AA0522_1220 [Gluconacetobacter liquefaciens NRIC 0522]GEB39135.1 hypothetical protein GLI01_31700 [Gluconacetobacter liquefaciens]